jgi:hypothetical protein
VLTQTGAVLTLERAQFLDTTLKSGAVDLALAFELDDLRASRVDHVVGLDLRAHRVFLSCALRQSQHCNCLLADVLHRSRLNRCGRRRLNNGSGNRWRWRRLHWRCCGSRGTLLGGSEAATKLSIFALQRAEF